MGIYSTNTRHQSQAAPSHWGVNIANLRIIWQTGESMKESRLSGNEFFRGRLQVRIAVFLNQ
jgi:hypothetical protein